MAEHLDVMERIRSEYREARQQGGFPGFHLDGQAEQVASRLRHRQGICEQQIQNAIAHANALLADAQQGDRVLQLAEQLFQQLGDGQTDQALTTIQDLKTQLADCQRGVQTQAAHALCEAVLRLAQSQMALFHSQDLTRLWEMVLNTEQHLMNLGPAEGGS